MDSKVFIYTKGPPYNRKKKQFSPSFKIKKGKRNLPACMKFQNWPDFCVLIKGKGVLMHLSKLERFTSINHTHIILKYLILKPMNNSELLDLPKMNYKKLLKQRNKRFKI